MPLLNEPPCKIGMHSQETTLIYIYTYARYRLLKYFRLTQAAGKNKKIVSMLFIC